MDMGILGMDIGHMMINKFVSILFEYYLNNMIRLIFQ